MSAEGGFPNQTGDIINSGGGVQFLTLDNNTLGITNGNSVVLPVSSNPPIIGLATNVITTAVPTASFGATPYQTLTIILPYNCKILISSVFTFTCLNASNTEIYNNFSATNVLLEAVPDAVMTMSGNGHTQQINCNIVALGMAGNTATISLLMYSNGIVNTNANAISSVLTYTIVPT